MSEAQHLEKKAADWKFALSEIIGSETRLRA
jgi:hypothetical protein